MMRSYREPTAGQVFLVDGRSCDQDCDVLEAVRTLIHRLRPDWRDAAAFYELRSEATGALTRLIRLAARNRRPRCWIRRRRHRSGGSGRPWGACLGWGPIMVATQATDAPGTARGLTFGISTSRAQGRRSLWCRPDPTGRTPMAGRRCRLDGKKPAWELEQEACADAVSDRHSGGWSVALARATEAP
jgi:hypothetical protein